MTIIPSSLHSLKKNHIDVWFIEPHRLSTEAIVSLFALLSDEETLKLQQYKNKAAQHTATVSRSLSRLILSKYTNTDPKSLKFIRSQHGKPALVNNINNLRFNLSHNNELIIMAICVNDEIGCDIEVLQELGLIKEWRKIYQIHQISYCYLARLVGEKGTPDFTESEITEGFEVCWLSSQGLEGA